MSVQPKPRYTVGEYLALELSTQQKHEYFQGEVFAMAGASYAHTVVVVNVAGELRAQLKGKPCRASSADLRIPAGDSGLWMSWSYAGRQSWNSPATR